MFVHVHDTNTGPVKPIWAWQCINTPEHRFQPYAALSSLRKASSSVGLCGGCLTSPPPASNFCTALSKVCTQSFAAFLARSAAVGPYLRCQPSSYC